MPQISLASSNDEMQNVKHTLLLVKLISSTVYLMYNFYNFHQLAGFLAGKKTATVRHFLKAIKKKLETFPPANPPCVDLEKQAAIQQYLQCLAPMGLTIVLALEYFF